MEITNEKNEKFGVYCGVASGKDVLVTGNYVILEFYSDFEVQARGFHLIFTAVPLSKYNKMELDRHIRRIKMNKM